MKKLLVASLVSAVSVSAAQAAPVMYGKLFVGLDYIGAKMKNGGQDFSTTTLNSNASRFGLKGEDELTPTLSAIYQIEYGVSAVSNGLRNSSVSYVNGVTLVNTGTAAAPVYTSVKTTNGSSTVGTAAGTGITSYSTATDLNARNRYLGLKSTEWGTLRFGRFDTALKESQRTVDVFKDTVGEAADHKMIMAGENRVDRVIGYEAPEIHGMPLKLNLNLILDQGIGGAGSTGGRNGDNAFSGSVAYDENGAYLAAAYDSRVVSTFLANPGLGTNLNSYAFNGVPANTVRVTAQFDLNKLAQIPGLQLGMLFQNSKPSVTNNYLDKQNAWLVSGSYKIPASVLSHEGYGVFAQYSESTTDLKNNTIGSVKRKQAGAGVSYAFSRKTAMYGYIARQSFEDLPYNLNVVGMALEHKF